MEKLLRQEGAVDDLSQILDLRESFERRGLTFYIHIDGAWGGYFASVLWNRKMQRCTGAVRQSVRQTSTSVAPLCSDLSAFTHGKRLVLRYPPPYF